MEDAFAYVLFGVVIVGGIGAAVALAFTSKTYEQIGKGGLFEDDQPRKPGGGGAAEDAGIRDEEIRQMLGARNALRSHRGGEQVDIESELAALTRPAVDPELEAEVRAFVISRNERRIAKGQEPLDVDAEVERRLRGLSG